MGKKANRIMIVDDEPDILEFLQYNLQQEGYDVLTCLSWEEALDMAEDFKPDLFILDVMMPEMDGVVLCERIRANKKFSQSMITFLTARSEDYTQIAALDAGGDDFITKPIKPRIFKSRINALMRRANMNEKESKKNELIYGDLVVNLEKYKVKKNGETIKMAKKEFELLKLLMSSPGKVFRRDEILNQVWGRDVIVGDRTIDVHIRKLREKLGNDYIKTLKGIGYKFEF
jgi:two-component system alkaline phosphatase synthesis response regulator PhoP